MAISDKTDLVVTKYTRQQFPVLDEGIRVYIQDELARIEKTVNQLAEASIQVADAAPTNPTKGMVRYAISPWNPLSNNYTGLVVWTGSAWAAV